MAYGNIKKAVVVEFLDLLTLKQRIVGSIPVSHLSVIFAKEFSVVCEVPNPHCGPTWVLLLKPFHCERRPMPNSGTSILDEKWYKLFTIKR